MSTPQPNFDDAGYGQVGCLFVIVGVVVGGVIAVLLQLIVPPAMPKGPDNNPLIQIGAILLLGFEVGLVAGDLILSLLKRTPALWPFSDLVIYGAAAIIPTIVILAATYVPPIAAVALPLSVVLLVILVAGPFLVMLIRMAFPPKDAP